MGAVKVTAVCHDPFTAGSIVSGAVPRAGLAIYILCPCIDDAGNAPLFNGDRLFLLFPPGGPLVPLFAL